MALCPQYTSAIIGLRALRIIIRCPDAYTYSSPLGLVVRRVCLPLSVFGAEAKTDSVIERNKIEETSIKVIIQKEKTH